MERATNTAGNEGPPTVTAQGRVDTQGKVDRWRLLTKAFMDYERNAALAPGKSG